MHKLSLNQCLSLLPVLTGCKVSCVCKHSLLDPPSVDFTFCKFQCILCSCAIFGGHAPVSCTSPLSPVCLSLVGLSLSVCILLSVPDFLPLASLSLCLYNVTIFIPRSEVHVLVI